MDDKNTIIKGNKITDIIIPGYIKQSLVVTLDTGELVYMKPSEIMKIKGFNETIFEAEKKRTRTWLSVKEKEVKLGMCKCGKKATIRLVFCGKCYTQFKKFQRGEL